MISSTTFTTLLMVSATFLPVSNALPFWSKRDNSPAQVAQGSNFFFDSLHLEDACTPGQIACVSSNLAKCSPEGNWEISPCTGNTTCLAVPSTDNGVLVQCMLFTDAQAAIGSDQVSQDFQVTSAPMNTATAVASPSATETASASATETETSATETATESASSTEEFTATIGSEIPSGTESATPTATEDPSSTCTEEGPEETEYQTVTVILIPNPAQSGVFVTSTLSPELPEPTETTSTESAPTETTSTEPTPTETGSVTEVTGTDAATSTSSSAEATPTCTEEPVEEEPVESESESESYPTETETSSTEEPLPTESVTESITTATESATSTESAPTESITTETSSSSSAAQETGITLTIAPGFSAPPPAAPTTTAIIPGINAPLISVVGTHFIPVTPAKMARKVRRS